MLISVTKIKCLTPPELEDAKNMGKLRKRYKVGEIAMFKCNTGIEEEERVCLSDGSWSGGNFVCGSKYYLKVYQLPLCIFILDSH